MLHFSRPRYHSLTSPISSFTVSGLKTGPIHCPDCFIESEDRDSFALAMNCIGNIKFFFIQPDCATKERLDALWSDVNNLERTLDNQHLLEELCALYIAGSFFQNEKLQKKTAKKLNAILKKTGPITDDQKLELLLDCINIGERMGVNGIELRQYIAGVQCKNEILQSGPIVDYAQRLYISF